MTTPILRHAGSGDGTKPASQFTNQQYISTGVTRHCVPGDHWRSIGGGWKKTGPLKLWICPECQKERTDAKLP